MSDDFRILLADDNTNARAGMKAALRAEADLNLVGEAVTFADAQQLCQTLQPDILLLAFNIVGTSLVETVTALHQLCPEMKIVILASNCDDMGLRALTAVGTVGCLLKSETPQALCQAIRAIAHGIASFSTAVLEKLPSLEAEKPPRSHKPDLTPRELKVLNLVAEGLTNREIALQLEITDRTVDFHVSNILQKLDVTSRVAAAVWAATHKNNL